MRHVPDHEGAVDRRQRLGLGRKARRFVRIVEHLERDDSTVLAIARAIDDGHAADPAERQHLEAIGHDVARCEAGRAHLSRAYSTARARA